MATIEVSGKTQTERLIHFALTTQGPLSLKELAVIVEGSPTHLERTLRSMLRDGIIRETDENGFRISLPTRWVYFALSETDARAWNTPRHDWKRIEGNLLLGGRFPGHVVEGPTAINRKSHLATLLDELHEFERITLGDERAIRALFPEYQAAVQQ